MKVKLKGTVKEIGEVIANHGELFLVKLNTPQIIYTDNGKQNFLVKIVGMYYAQIEPMEGKFQDGSIEGVEIIKEEEQKVEQTNPEVPPTE